MSPYAIHKRICSLCVRTAGLIPPWQKEADLLYCYEFGNAFEGTISENSGNITHHVKTFCEAMFIAKQYLNPQRLLSFGTNKCKKKHKNFFSTSVSNRYYRRFSDFSGLLFTGGFRVSTFNANARLNVSLKWLHSTPNISGILRMVLSQSKSVHKLFPLKYEDKYTRYFKVSINKIPADLGREERTSRSRSISTYPKIRINNTIQNLVSNECQMNKNSTVHKV